MTAMVCTRRKSTGKSVDAGSRSSVSSSRPEGGASRKVLGLCALLAFAVSGLLLYDAIFRSFSLWTKAIALPSKTILPAFFAVAIVVYIVSPVAAYKVGRELNRDAGSCCWTTIILPSAFFFGFLIMAPKVVPMDEYSFRLIGQFIASLLYAFVPAMMRNPKKALGKIMVVQQQDPRVSIELPANFVCRHGTDDIDDDGDRKKGR